MEHKSENKSTGAITYTPVEEDILLHTGIKNASLFNDRGVGKVKIVVKLYIFTKFNGFRGDGNGGEVIIPLDKINEKHTFTKEDIIRDNFVNYNFANVASDIEVDLLNDEVNLISTEDILREYNKQKVNFAKGIEREEITKLIQSKLLSTAIGKNEEVVFLYSYSFDDENALDKKVICATFQNMTMRVKYNFEYNVGTVEKNGGSCKAQSKGDEFKDYLLGLTNEFEYVLSDEPKRNQFLIAVK